MTCSGETCGNPNPVVRMSRTQAVLTLIALLAAGPTRAQSETRLFLLPTARALPEESGRISGYYFLMPALDIGLVKRLSVGGIFSIIPMIDLEDQLKVVSPRIGIIQRESLALAAGGFYMQGFDREARIGYAAATRSGERGSVTAGIGYGAGGRVVSRIAGKVVNTDIEQTGFVMLGADYSLGPRARFVSENWSLPGGDMRWLSAGVRLGGARWSWDLALVKANGGERTNTFPLIGLTRSF